MNKEYRVFELQGSQISEKHLEQKLKEWADCGFYLKSITETQRGPSTTILVVMER